MVYHGAVGRVRAGVGGAAGARGRRPEFGEHREGDLAGLGGGLLEFAPGLLEERLQARTTGTGSPLRQIGGGDAAGPQVKAGGDEGLEDPVVAVAHAGECTACVRSVKPA